MKKLCYICEATEGGVRKHLRDLIRSFSLPGEGFEIHAILGDRGEPGLREELESLPLRYTFVPDFQRSISSLRDTRAYMHVKDLLRKINPAIVHTHNAKAGFLGRYAAHHLRIKKILHTPHVFPFQWTFGLQSRIYLALERQVARFSDALICVGESQRADALKRGVAEAAKLVVVRNGIELPSGDPATIENARAAARRTLNIAGDQLAVGMVARMAPQKGVGAFVKSAALILKKKPECVFFVIGGGPLEAEVRARMAENNVSPEQFRILGHRQDAPQLYPGFDVAVLSSLYEGLPYVLLEAMAWGVPIIATDVLGSRDVVADGQTGFLARVNDPAHIAERTLLLLDDPPLRRRYGAAARQRVADEFSFQNFIDGHRRLYND